MTTLIFSVIIDSEKILKNPIDNINIIGGEPTLHPQFKQILENTKEKTIMSLNDRLDSCDKIINALKEEQRIWAM